MGKAQFEYNEDYYRNMRLSVAGLASDVGTATASAGAATLNDRAGKITTEALTTAQDLFYTLVLTNSFIAAADMVFVSVGNGTNSAGTPILTTVTPAAGSVTLLIQNKHLTAVALNGTLKISFFVVNAL